MAFKILAKLKVKVIQDRSLDTSFLGKYYKKLQVDLLKHTNPEIPTSFFLCQNYSNGEHLLVMGDQTMGHKKLFENAGKGNDGFDKTTISLGTCFIHKTNGKSILYVHPNMAKGKAKKESLLKVLLKMCRSHMKKIDGVQLIDGPVIIDAKDKNKLESAEEKDTNVTSVTDKEPSVKKAEIVRRTQEIKKGREKLKNNILKRYKKKELSTKYVISFVNALRKAGVMCLSKLTQTDEKTTNEFSKEGKKIAESLKTWIKLEKLLSKKAGKEATVTMKKDLKDAVARMNNTRNEIKKLLKRVDLKTLG